MRSSLGSMLLAIGAVLTLAGLWLWIGDMPGAQITKVGLVCMSFGFMFRMLGPGPSRHRRDREP